MLAMSSDEVKLKEIISLKEITFAQLYDPLEPICRQNYLRITNVSEGASLGWREAKAIYEFLGDYLVSINVLDTKNN